MGNADSTLVEGFGQRLAIARKSLKDASGRWLTQNALGASLGVRNTAVSKWEMGIREIDERSLIAMETRWGINPEWIRTGEQPMILPTAKRAELTESLAQLAPGGFDGTWRVPAAMGMEPAVREGDMVLYRKEPLVSGAMVLLELKSAGKVMHRIGEAYLVDPEVSGLKPQWILTRIQANEHPQTFSPLPFKEEDVLGRAILVVRSLVAA